ncbi:MAG: TIGR00341 family protein [Armatimonadota bacterium]|nr:TIGR00341 family protein [Armatimonadota bacterium]
MSVLRANAAGEAAALAPNEQTRQETVRQNIHENASLTVPYLIMNALAAVVACYGLLQNSAAVIIGAMVIALLLGPITGMALALVDGDQPLLRKALSAEAVGVGLVLLIGCIIGKIHAEMTLGSEIMGRTSPNLLDLIIALVGGAAGAYATISRRLSAGLVGVAIATALVPPLCSCGICLAHGLYRQGGGAFLLFLTNLVAIQSVTSLVFWLSGFHRLAPLDKKTVLRRFAPSTLLLAGLAVFLIRSFDLAVTQERLRSTTERLLRREIEKNGAASLADLRIENEGSRTTLVAVVRAPWIIQPSSCARLQSEVRRATGQAVDLRIWTVLTRQCDAHGFLNETLASGDASAVPAAGNSVNGTGTTPGQTDTLKESP